MDNNPKVMWSGFGLCDILFIVFLILKLTKTIAWSWWWVTAPLWMPFGLVIGILIIIFISAGIAIGIKALIDS